MTLTLRGVETVLFQGDSVTEGGRLSDPGRPLGHGYPSMVAEAVRAGRPGGVTWVNRAVGGDRVADLRARWKQDTLDVEPTPDLVSVLVGVNDTWFRYRAGETTSARAYEDDYRSLLTQVRDRLDARLVLVEPFLVPVTAEQWAWREDLDPRIHVVRRLAEEFDAALLAADGLLNQAARAAGGPESIAGDGVHPTPLGHTVLARAWLALVKS
ncbi:GDSL-type esterase/lipase family protein [Streptomyces sp. NBC_01754]|uniref:GDSL-type esterase/lipase family protein n=1 Tax=Streptomyces sp. NBC_01754 TaxID=2975930 RepID=UPI002DD9725B|nr:GDSL-type esterase/lipase family protein [Streptomyces sp. NBC_01754]WSC96504.1 GDSL-type esterase/lipase family protein [Streptomyces sp. NBC_01754]